MSKEVVRLHGLLFAADLPCWRNPGYSSSTVPLRVVNTRKVSSHIGAGHSRKLFSRRTELYGIEGLKSGQQRAHKSLQFDLSPLPLSVFST